MDYEAINRQLTQKREDLGQRIAKMPEMESNLRESMFGNDAVTNTLNTQERSKIDELFSHDQTVAAQYQTPPQQGQILDPYIRELQLTNRYRGTAGDLTKIRQGQQTRRDVIGDSLQNALKLAQQSLEMKKMELDSLERDRDFAWDVYKEKNKKTGGSGGGQGVSQALFNSILGLQEKVQAAAPAKEGKTVQRIGQQGAGGKVQTKASLMSQIQKQNPGKQLRYTFNKDGTISYSVDRPTEMGQGRQFLMETPEAAVLEEAGGFEGLVQKLGTAAVAQGASGSDVQAMLNYFTSGNTKAATRGQTQDDAIVQFTANLEDPAVAGLSANDLYLRAKTAYPSIPDSTLKQMISAKTGEFFF